MVAEPPLLVALDLDSAEEAVRLARRLLPTVGGFKVGLQLVMGPGPATVAALAELGKPVMADVKLHDIPSTVRAAARQLGRFGARWVTVHASGGKVALEAAREGLEQAGEGGVLAVTVLTSLDSVELARVGLGDSSGRATARLARLAGEAGSEGVVCAVHELGVVADVAPGLLRVTPGIRPAGSDGDDQARVATPEEAQRRGADLLVVGRPITRASDPEEAARKMVESLRPIPDSGRSA